MKKLLASVAMIATVTVANAELPDLGPQDVKYALDTYKVNELRFNRDYVGRTIYFQWSLLDVSKTLFGNKYLVTFGAQPNVDNVVCQIDDKATLDKVVNWNPGQMVNVRGTIDNALFGNLGLTDCTLDAVSWKQS